MQREGEVELEANLQLHEMSSTSRLWRVYPIQRGNLSPVPLRMQEMPVSRIVLHTSLHRRKPIPICISSYFLNSFAWVLHSFPLFLSFLFLTNRFIGKRSSSKNIELKQTQNTNLTDIIIKAEVFTWFFRDFWLNTREDYYLHWWVRWDPQGGRRGVQNVSVNLTLTFFLFQFFATPYVF